MKRSLILLGLVCSLSTTFALTSCNGGETSTSDNNSSTVVGELPLDVRPMEVIYAKTPKSEELAAEYYENVISKVTVNDKWDGDKLISLATFVSSSDGDTTSFLLNTKSGQETIKIRYMGVDTPELHHDSKGAEAWGLAAKQFVEYRINEAIENNWNIVIEGGITSTATTYNREVGYVWCGPHCLNYELLEIGLAKLLQTDGPENDRHYKECQTLYRYRTLSNGFPMSRFGDFYFHCMSYPDPNWDSSKDNKTNIETNPAADLDYKYTFDFEHEGKLTEIPLCVENKNLCIS